MSNVFILHDLDEQGAKNITEYISDSMIFSATPIIKNCIGCFGCWIKTPGACVIHDRGDVLPKLWASANHVIIISRLVYGGLSPEIKACMDRSIGYLLPNFRIVDDEMHHKMRYSNEFSLDVYFYKKNINNINQEEKNLANQLVKANAINLGAVKSHAHFYESITEIKEVLI